MAELSGREASCFFKVICWCLLKIGNWITHLSNKHTFERRCNQIKRARLLHQKAHVNTSLNDSYFSVWIQPEPESRGLDSDTSAEKTHLARQTMPYVFSRLPVICNKTCPCECNYVRNLWNIMWRKSRYDFPPHWRRMLKCEKLT